MRHRILIYSTLLYCAMPISASANDQYCLGMFQAITQYQEQYHSALAEYKKTKCNDSPNYVCHEIAEKQFASIMDEKYNYSKINDDNLRRYYQLECNHSYPLY